MVIVEKLGFIYRRGSPIFQDFSWSMATGERWALIGPSGCGKTTLLYLLAGLRFPTSGTIRINGSRTEIGLILQDYGLLPWATAYENVSLGLRIHRVQKTEVRRITEHWMEALDIASVARHYPAELSGGQRQRVAIARTLALEPTLLLMDEPFASLDTLTRENLLDLTLDLWRQGQPSTMVLVSHNIEESVYWGNRILVLKSPPHTQPQIVENPGAGSPSYRNTPEFDSRCQLLRDLLGEAMTPENTLKNKAGGSCE